MRLTALALLGLISTLAIAQDPIPGIEEPFPHLAIQALSEDLTKLTDASLIAEKKLPELQRPLNQSVEALQSADPSLSVQRLKVFKNKLSAQVVPEIGDELVMQASAIQEQITAIASRSVAAFNGSCEVPVPDDFQSLAVGPGEALTSITDALSFATMQGFSAVEIVLSPVAFREGSITIDRHTRFTAPAGAANIVGGIINSGPYLLELQDVIVTGSAGAGTGILAANQCAITILSNVEVQFADGTGITQLGGTFTADGLTVVASNAPDFPTAAERHIGRGLHISDGASACITNSTLDRNAAGALLAEGFLTRVFASRLTARNNSISPVVRDELVAMEESPSGFASIEIRGEALMLGEFVAVFAGDVIGIMVDDNAQAHFRYSAVARTVDIPIGPFKSVGGRNLSVNNGVMELNAIDSRQRLAGIVTNYANGGFLSTGTVLVTQNAVGLGVISSSSDESACALACLDVFYVRNDRRADFTFPPLPGPTPPSCPVCPSVSYSPSWCGLPPV